MPLPLHLPHAFRPAPLPESGGVGYRQAVFLCLLVLLCLGPMTRGAAAAPDLTAAMATELSCYPLEILEFQRQKPLLATKELCLSSIYHELGGQPLWVTEAGPSPRAREIFERLRTSDTEGLDPADYEVPLLLSLWDSRDLAELARLDTLLTYNLVKYIHDLSYGQMKFHTSDPGLFAEAGNDSFSPLVAVETLLASADVGAYLDSLPPQHRHYRDLRQALTRYRELARVADWPMIPNGPLIRPGQADERLAAIQKRLEATGDLEATEPVATSYTPLLVDGMTAFQRRYGLEPDGIIGPKTIEALNVPVEDLITTIRVNMARWRWHDHDLGRRYVMVNIAGFNLKAVSDGQVRLDMPVIVGKSQHQTPVFSDTIRYLDFNPFWNVTPSIARNEELPELRRNPSHLVERNIRLFSSWEADAVELDSTMIDWETTSRSQMSRYKLRQDPGPWNALGKVKFVFPNHYSIYLHDTPTQDLFEHASRPFSHGCIRVSEPLALARFCLEDQGDGWSPEVINRTAAAGERKIVRVQPPLPVHITYQTSWVDNDGGIHFNGDIYGRDAKLVKVLLNQERDRPRLAEN